MFCFNRVARDVMAGGYGVPGGKYRLVFPVSSPWWPPTLKDSRTTRGGEIRSYYASSTGGIIQPLEPWN